MFHHLLHTLVGFVVSPLPTTRRRDEDGLSQSTENAVLLAGAVSIALIVVTAITAYVKRKLPR